MSRSIVFADGEGEKRWFFGGGVHTWKATAEETNGSLLVLEDTLVRGKTTPLHRHPGHDEVVYVVDGEVDVFANGEVRRVGRGGTVINLRGTAHAFHCVSETARLLFIQTPGDADAFYRGASQAMTEGEGPVDFRKIAEVAKATGITEILGPPPFGAK